MFGALNEWSMNGIPWTFHIFSNGLLFKSRVKWLQNLHCRCRTWWWIWWSNRSTWHSLQLLGIPACLIQLSVALSPWPFGNLIFASSFYPFNFYFVGINGGIYVLFRLRLVQNKIVSCQLHHLLLLVYFASQCYLCGRDCWERCTQRAPAPRRVRTSHGFVRPPCWPWSAPSCWPRCRAWQ